MQDANATILNVFDGDGDAYAYTLTLTVTP